jgi:hypothetical protein
VKEILLSLCTVVYFCIVAVQFTDNMAIKNVVWPITRPTVMALGLEQNWYMFCPIVRETNFYINSTITFADGSTRLYEAPRLYLQDMWTRTRKQRMNKTFLDAWERPVYSYYWPFVAAYLARCNNNPTNPPVMVALSINFCLIPPIEAPISRDSLHPETIHATYFVYKVRPEDLQ